MSSLNHDALKQRRAGARAGAGWKPKEGENRVRVLPPHSRYLSAWDTLQDIAVQFRVHFFRITGRPTEVSRCLEELKQRCPACEAWRIWRTSEDQGFKELARQVAPADQYLMNIIDMGNQAAGIQYWVANYTCWDKILEIVANPGWGNVLDPISGVNFVVSMTPGNRSRTGYNQYSVLPEPNRESIADVLARLSDWMATLDALIDQIPTPKEADEIRGLIEEMGFPPPPGRVSTPTAQPPQTTAQPPQTTGRATPGATWPTSSSDSLTGVGRQGDAAPAVAEDSAAQPPQTMAAQTGTVHYDPGAAYVPKVPDAERPVGVPRCFGDYDPTVHRCQPCPVVAECQMKMLGIV